MRISLRIPWAVQVDSCQGHQAGEAKQERGAALARQIGPVPLGFDAQVGAALLTRGFSGPTMPERRDARFGSKRLIGPQQGFDRAFPFWITGEDPTDGQRRVAKAIPQGGAAAPLKRARALPIACKGTA